MLDFVGYIFTEMPEPINSTIRVALVVFVVVYAVIPTCLVLFPQIQHTFVFLHIAKFPTNIYSDLQKNSVKGRGRNFYIDNDNGNVRLGTWHILPSSLWDEVGPDATDADFEELIRGGGRPVVVYLHGNAGTRAAAHRVDLYNVLTQPGLDYHVIASDYRGFGDSTGSPTEDGVVSDAVASIRYAQRLAGPGNRVLVWGHSLGTSISTSAVAEICDAAGSEQPVGLVLESPFDVFENVTRSYPLCLPYSVLPVAVFDRLFCAPCRARGVRMDTAGTIHRVSVPILMLMARDDLVVPFQLAVNLRTAGEASARQITWVEFAAARAFGHKFIWRAPELPDILTNFHGNGESASAPNLTH